MATQNHGIVKDERGQDQPVSKKAAHRAEPTVLKDARELDPRDVVQRVHEPVDDVIQPQPEEPVKIISHRVAQPEVDALSEHGASDPGSDLPEGLRRPRAGPYSRRTGRA